MSKINKTKQVKYPGEVLMEWGRKFIERQKMDSINIYVGECYQQFFPKEEKRYMVFDLFTDKPEHLEELHRFAESFKISRKCFKEDSYFPHYEIVFGCGCKTLRLAACPVDAATQKEFAGRWQVITMEHRF